MGNAAGIKRFLQTQNPWGTVTSGDGIALGAAIVAAAASVVAVIAYRLQLRTPGDKRRAAAERPH
jgi:hypothetical protein